VLPGDMSFVGPRPERPHFVEMLRKVVPYYDQRHNVKPGVTGWAQIKFGYASTIEDAERKLQFDLYYVKNMSFLLDLAIVLDTLKVMWPRWAGREAGAR
jgi:lipopolysaccharide/colanic/teichoic acid biosynthesis glycosyltransferase